MRNTLKKSILILAGLYLSIILSITVKGGQSQLFTSDRDLTGTLINHLMMDSQGFLWISTESGLNCYDGAKFSKYNSRSGKDGALSHDFVNSVFEDSHGNLFVCTYSGLQIYDKLNNNFPVKALKPDGSAFTDAVKAVVQMPDGRLVAIGTYINEIEVDVADGRVTMKPLPYTNKLLNVSTAVADRRGNLWISTNNDPIVKIGKDNSIKRYNPEGSNDADQFVFEIAPDGRMIIGSSSGKVYIYDVTTDSFELMDDDTLAGLRITDLLFDHGILYICTDGSGLYSCEVSKGRIERATLPFWHDSTLKIHSMIKDTYNNMWFGLYQKGLLMVSAYDSGFNTIDQRSAKNAYIGQSCVTSILRDPSGELWVGTDNDGIYHLTADFGTSKHYFDGVPRVVMQLFRTSSGQMLVGSYGNGFGTLSQEGRYSRIPLVTSDGSNADHVYAFAETPDGNVWIATMGRGLFKYNPSAGTTTHIDVLSDKINPWISDIIYSDRDKHLYLGTYDGLYKVDPESFKVDVVTQGMIVTTVYEDSDRHNFWLGTPSGLALSPGGGAVKKIYTTAEGLPSNTIYALQKSGNSMWISTNNGLSQLNLENGQFVNYDVNEGLQSNEFFKNSSFADSRGNLYFGGINGISYFNPDNINTSGKKLDLRVTDFYVRGESVRNGMLSGGRRIIDAPVYEARVFRLDNEDNSFSVEFATRQMTYSANTEFYYSFDGNAWERMPKNNIIPTVSEGNMITFSNVKSGRHTLNIKAVENGLESDILSIDVIVSAPWYLSWWAKLIYTFIILTAACLLFLHMKSRGRRKDKELVQKHESDIREAKLQFFTNISHEIRTPLTLVMSPVQKLMNEDTDPGRQKVYRTIMRNSQRIHKLVDEIMDLRKIDNNQMHLRYREVNIVGFIRDLYSVFLPAANNKGIDIQFEHEGLTELMAWVDPDNFDKIVMNLLSNAVKYTPRGGYIKIILSRGENPADNGPLRNYMCIKVLDSGIGISEADRAHIFERFYQSGNNKVGGTGIGLHLTHSLIMLHKGNITVSDNPLGQGVCFTVILPTGNSHLRSDDIDTTESSSFLDNDTLEFNTMIAEQSVVPEVDNSPTPAGGKLLYVVDDDNEVRNYLTQTLGERYRVESFANGAEALEAVHRQVPDLIITDVMMPEMDGLTLASKLRQNVNFNHIPMVMLSAKNREEDTIEGLDTGADAYLTKPFNLEILMRTVRNLLENRRILRNVYSGNQHQSDRIEEIKVQSNDEKLIERVMKVVNKNISNPNITVETIAREVGISRVHLHRKLKELTNQSTRDFIRNIRLQQAARLLREKKLSVAEVSDLVGFKHPNNFSTNFKEMFGISPSAYAEQYHSSADPLPSAAE